MSVFRAHISEERLHEHDRRMLRVGLIVLAGCVVVGVSAVAIAVELSIIAFVASIGAFFAVTILLRARRGLRERGGLVVVVQDKSVITERINGAGAQPAAPIMGAQAFPDHIQIVVSDAPSRLRQIELPLEGEERRRLLEHLRAEAGLSVGERSSVGVTLLVALTAVPAAVLALFLAYRALMLVLAFGVVSALSALGPQQMVIGLAVLAALGLGILGRRLMRR